MRETVKEASKTVGAERETGEDTQRERAQEKERNWLIYREGERAQETERNW